MSRGTCHSRGDLHFRQCQGWMQRLRESREHSRRRGRRRETLARSSPAGGEDSITQGPGLGDTRLHLLQGTLVREVTQSLASQQGNLQNEKWGLGTPSGDAGAAAMYLAGAVGTQGPDSRGLWMPR